MGQLRPAGRHVPETRRYGPAPSAPPSARLTLTARRGGAKVPEGGRRWAVPHLSANMAAFFAYFIWRVIRFKPGGSA